MPARARPLPRDADHAGGTSPVPVAPAHRRRVTPAPPHVVHTMSTSPPRPPRHVRSGGDDIGPLAIGAGIFGLAAIGIVGALDRRRRRQRMTRAPGRRIPLPAPHSAAADLELALAPVRPGRRRVLADPSRRPVGLRRRPRRRPSAERCSASRSSPVVSTSSWQERLAKLPRHSSAGARARRLAPPAHAPIPVCSTRPWWQSRFRLTLFSVGQRAGVSVLINLEHYSSVHVQVPAERAPGTLAAIGTELAASSGSRARGSGRRIRPRGDRPVRRRHRRRGSRCRAASAAGRGEQTIVLVDGAMVIGELTELGQRTDVRLVTAGPVAPAGTGLVIDPTHPTLVGPPVQPVDPTHVDRGNPARRRRTPRPGGSACQRRAGRRAVRQL